MPTRLIVNADDFGLTRGINRAVRDLCSAGALTSATLMATGAAFDDAVDVARSNATVGVGCHVVLVDGVPVLHPADIPTLLGPDGKTFRTSVLDFMIAAHRGRISSDEIVREALAQIQKLQRAGLDVTHLDTHKHTHMVPRVARALLYAAERAGIGAIRNPFEPAWSVALSGASPTRRLQVALLSRLRHHFLQLPQIRSGAIQTSDGSLGISATGSLDASTLRAMLDALPDGLWELVCHPGYNDRDLDAVHTRLRASREIERAALLSTFASDSLRPSAPALIHYGEVGPIGVMRALGQHQPNTGYETIL